MNMPTLELEDSKTVSNASIKKPDLHYLHSDSPVAELLSKAGLSRLLSTDEAIQSASQWIFYNGLLLSAPSKSPIGVSTTKQNSHLSLIIPKTNAEPQLIYLIYIYGANDILNDLSDTSKTPKISETSKAYETYEASKAYEISKTSDIDPHHDTHHDTTHPLSTQISILAEEEASASIIEYHVGLGVDKRLSDAHHAELRLVQTNTLINLKNEAKIDHCIMTQHACGSPKIAQVNVLQGSQSEYRGFLASFGSSSYKTNIAIELAGQKAYSDFNLLMTPKNSEQVNIELNMHHKVANCQSRILARAVLQDESRFNFIGKIIVDKIAQGTDARLENKNLLLCRKAQAHTEPQLEIYNGNIQCSHGATVGHIDEDALFYLQARGISKSDAMQMLIQAFLQPVIHKIPHPPLQVLLENMINEQRT